MMWFTKENELIVKNNLNSKQISWLYSSDKLFTEMSSLKFRNRENELLQYPPWISLELNELYCYVTTVSKNKVASQDLDQSKNYFCMF